MAADSTAGKDNYDMLRLGSSTLKRFWCRDASMLFAELLFQFRLVRTFGSRLLPRHVCAGGGRYAS